MNKVLCIAVHPDDETLGCGGTLLKHKSMGDEIHWIIATQTNENHMLFKQREEEILEVASLYKFTSVNKLGFITTEIDRYQMNTLIDKISKIINEIKPNIIYLPFKSDVHSDHRKIFEASYSCTKSFRYPFIKKIYMMETLSETEFAVSLKEDSFIPNTYIDITSFLDKKIEIMKKYNSELGEHPFPRSINNIKALATYRGASASVFYAESFMLLKEIN